MGTKQHVTLSNLNLVLILTRKKMLYEIQELKGNWGDAGLPQRVAYGFHFPYIFHQILGTTVMFCYRVPQN